MSTTWFQKIVLGLSGLTAAGVGLAILADPVGFYAGYGISIGDSPSLLNELRAPGANLAGLGAIMLVGAVKPAWTRFSAALGAMVFLAFAFGRLVSIAVDGWPAQGLVDATLIELAIGCLCLITLRRRAGTTPARLALDTAR